MIPLSRPDITKLEIDEVVKVLKTPNLALGPKIGEFERIIAKHIGVKYAVALNSGTAALHLAVRALDLKDGDEVITTPFSFISSSNCILYERAKPVFVDIDEKTLCIDHRKIEKAITKRTKAILAVDIFGHPAQWPEILKIAQKHNLRIIEDSAEALGSQYEGKKCGSFGNIGILSFYPNKQITTGEGGMLLTDNKKIAKICESLRNQGRGKGEGWLFHPRFGYNYRISDINCALGIAQMKRIREILAKRERVADLYNEKLKKISEIETPFIAPKVKIGWFVYVARLKEDYKKKRRDAILRELRKRGIDCRDYFAPIHLQPPYIKMFGFKEGDFPVCESVAKRTIALPFYNNLREKDVDFVVKTLKSILEN